MCPLPRHWKQGGSQEGAEAVHGQSHGVIEERVARAAAIHCENVKF